MALLEYPSLNLTEQSFQAILIVLEKLPQIDPFFLIFGTLSIIWSITTLFQLQKLYTAVWIFWKISCSTPAIIKRKVSFVLKKASPFTNLDSV